jgi:hypothetical protein
MGTHYSRIIIFILVLFMTSCSHAATLVQYAITGDSLETTTNAANIAGGTLTNASLGTFVANNLSYATAPVIRLIPPGGTTNASTAVSNNAYFSFTVTPTNVEMDLVSLTFEAARGGSSTPRGWVLRSSVDSYATNIDTDTISTVRTTLSTQTIDLTGAAFQNLTSAITFRIYFYTPSTSSSIEVDDITVTGSTTAVGSGLTSDTFDDAIPTITRWVEIERGTTTLTAKIYSDNQFTTLLDTLQVFTSATTHRYLYVGMTYNSGVSGSSFSGTISDLDVDAGSGNPPASPVETQSTTLTGGSISSGATRQ